MSFGYLGDTSTKIKQQVKNQGVISVSEAYELEKAGQLSGSLELIETVTISSPTASVDFTSIKGDIYESHFLTATNIQTVTDGAILRIRFSNDGGSSFETSNYEMGRQFQDASGSNGTSDSTSIGYIEFSVNIGASTAESGAGNAYFHRLNNASFYSVAKIESTGVNASGVYLNHFGGGTYKVAEKVDGIRLVMSSGNIDAGVYKLYGIKEQ
jgi:hypothetical protein